ncbi:MAG: caspase family protein [Pseudomonadota bacterium]
MIGRLRNLTLGALGLAFVPFAPAPALADIYGLVVGIDRYEHLPVLAGAVNDARDIEDALGRVGAKKVITLIDGEATRDRIMAAWNEITAAAVPGDTVVFTYAGHGGQEPEKVKGSEADGLDEAFQLAGFQHTRPGNRERILDNEINLMFAKARHLKIIFVADSCHSGTMTRSFDNRAGTLRTRLGGYGEIIDDPLPPPNPNVAKLDVEDLDNVVYFGAVRDDQVAQEFKIEQKARGLLSWSFARAMRGGGDIDGDGFVNTSELSTYLTENVRTKSEGRQYPQMTPRGKPAEVSIRVAPEAPAERDLPAAVSIINAAAADALTGELQNTVAAKTDLADLIWDFATGDIITSSGDVLARIGPSARPARAQGVIDKWLLLRDIAKLSEKRPLSLRVGPDDSLHRAGSQVTISVSGQQHDKLIVFNLAVDGTVQYLIPVHHDPNPHYRGQLVPGETLEFPLKVVPPFGADHLIALSAPRVNHALIDALNSLNGRKAAGEGRVLIRELLKGETFQLGQVGLFTTER